MEVYMITKLEKAAAISLLMQFLDSRIRISPKVVLNLDEGLGLVDLIYHQLQEEGRLRDEQPW